MTIPAEPTKKKSALEIALEEKQAAERDKKDNPPETKGDKPPSEISDINQQIAKIEAETKLELVKRNLSSLKEWETEKKKQQDALNAERQAFDDSTKKQSELLTDQESKLKEQEVELSGKQAVLDDEIIKNQLWSDKLDKAEKGLKAEIAQFLKVKGNDKEIMRVNIENLMKYLCTPLVYSQDGYSMDCVDNVISNSVKIVANLLQQRCGVTPVYNEVGEYLSVETRAKLGLKPNGEKFKEV